MDEDCVQADVVTSESYDNDVTCGVSSSDFADIVAVSNCKDENETTHTHSSPEISHETVSGSASPIPIADDQRTVVNGPGDVTQSESALDSLVGMEIPSLTGVDVKSTDDSFDQKVEADFEFDHDVPPEFTGNENENGVKSLPTPAAVSTVDEGADQLTTNANSGENAPVDDEEHFHLSANSQIAADAGTDVNIELETPKIDFTAGIRCSDVPTALDILNTRYRLADVTIHKNMITWSSWNIGDIVRGPHRESFCWVGKRRGCYAATLPSRSDTLADDGFVSKNRTENGAKENGADGRIRDMESLCEKIELKEKEIERMLQRDEQRQRDSAAAVCHVTNEEPVTVDKAPLTSSAAPPGDANQRRRENIFQRLIRALRQRFSRQSSECHDPRQPCDAQDRGGACSRSKQRTL